jgi:hypothetical protein
LVVNHGVWPEHDAGRVPQGKGQVLTQSRDLPDSFARRFT